jgi:mono/diheme cytochrome c family protein
MAWRSVRVLVMLLATNLVAVHAQQTRTANDRVYSDAQAARGEALYKERCASCHGALLQGQNGPPLAGSDFLAIWARQPLADLANKIRITMPENDPGKLSRQQAADLVAYLLRAGKFPAGSADLVADEAALKLITLAMPPGAAVTAPAPAPLVASHGPAFPPSGNLAQLMRGILFPSSNLIFNVQTYNPDDIKPASTTPGSGGFSWVDWGAGIYKPWELVDYAAIAIAETAPLMLTPGRRCENGKPVPVDEPRWIKFTQEMAEAGMAAYKASQTRNQETVSDATNQIADSCLNCHVVFRDRPVRGAEPGNKASRCTIP